METLGRFAVYKGIEYFAYETKQGIMLTSDDEASNEKTVPKSELSRVWWEVKDLLGNVDCGC